MARLYDWYLTKEKYGDKDYIRANGIVTGHTRLEDSDFIHTTAIERVHVAENDNVVILTSNTEYHCSMADAKFTEFSDTTWISNFDIFKEKYANSRSKEYQTAEDTILLVLGNNKEYYFDRMIFNQGGVSHTIDEACVHVGTFQDSVLNRYYDEVNDKHIRYDYFPYKNRCLEFYSWSDVSKVFVENCGDDNLFIKALGCMFRIKPSERKEIVVENADTKELEQEFTTVDLHNILGE